MATSPFDRSDYTPVLQQMFHESFFASSFIRSTEYLSDKDDDDDDDADADDDDDDDDDDNEDEAVEVGQDEPNTTHYYNPNPFVYTPGGSGEASVRCCIPTVVNLPKPLTVIGDNAFQGCDELVTVNMPDSLTTVGDHAFDGCHKITNVVFPESVTAIGCNAFQDCRSITSITLPPSLNSVCKHAFVGCTALTTIDTPTFPSTSIHPVDFERALLEANYTLTKLSDVITDDDDRPCRLCIKLGSSIYYDRKIWWEAAARIRDERGRLPLCIAAERSLAWSDTQQVFAANMPAIEEKDTLTGLQLFMLAAVGPKSDLDSIYCLLLEFPPALMEISNSMSGTKSYGGVPPPAGT